MDPKPQPQLKHDEELTRFLDAWFAVRQMIQAANFNKFHKAGLSATQFMTLNVLPAKGGMHLTELARRMNLSPATVSKTVASLQARGMLTRTPSEGDARRIQICSTPMGRKLQNAAASDFHDYMSALFQAVPADRREALISGLEALVRAGQSRNEDDAARAGHNAPRSRKQ